MRFALKLIFVINFNYLQNSIRLAKNLLYSYTARLDGR